MTEINAYCDESCHLLNDKKPIMAIGALFCPSNRYKEISKDIFYLKSRHNIGHDVEFKWLKVSPNKLSFYLALVEYFFSQEDLNFRGLVVKEKSKLNHEDYEQTHDDWYYKMYYQLIKPTIDRNNTYNIFLDIKDTRSESKVKKLHQVLSNSLYDFDHSLIKKVQSIRSHETNLMQLSDLLLGAISHANRDEGQSMAKKALINEISKFSNCNLKNTTYLKETKFNLFLWHPNNKNSLGP